MKDILEFAKSKIEECDGPLKELLTKHGSFSTFDLMQKTDLPEEDVRTAIKFIQRRDAFVTLVNHLSSAYDPSLYVDDPDVDVKRRAVYSVAGHVLDHVTKPNSPEWKRIDGIPVDNVLQHVVGCIMADELENALFGLTYVIFQRQFQKTNRAEEKLKLLIGPEQPGSETEKGKADN